MWYRCVSWEDSRPVIPGCPEGLLRRRPSGAAARSSVRSPSLPPCRGTRYGVIGSRPQLRAHHDLSRRGAVPRVRIRRISLETSLALQVQMEERDSRSGVRWVPRAARMQCWADSAPPGHGRSSKHASFNRRPGATRETPAESCWALRPCGGALCRRRRAARSLRRARMGAARSRLRVP